MKTNRKAKHLALSILAVYGSVGLHLPKDKTERIVQQVVEVHHTQTVYVYAHSIQRTKPDSERYY